MNSGLMHRLVILLGLILAILAFVMNYARSGDLYYSAFWALCVLFASSIVMLVAMKNVATVLLRHLQEKQRIQREILMEEALKKKKEEMDAALKEKNIRPEKQPDAKTPAAS